MRLALGAFYGGCGVVLSPSRVSDARLVRAGHPGRSGSAAGTAASTSSASPRRGASPGGFGERINVLYAGRLTAEKGADLLADAFLEAARARPAAAPACSPAAAPRRSALRAPARRRRDVPRLARGRRARRHLRGADLFLFCSRTDTFGQVILEAQASGLPVVAVAEGGPAELIADGRTRPALPARRRGAGRRGLPASPARARPASGSSAAAWPRCASAPGTPPWRAWRRAGAAHWRRARRA